MRVFCLKRATVDNFPGCGDVIHMNPMHRFISAALMLIFRLAIVVSLGGYSVSALNAAMHPDQPAQVSQQEMDHGLHAGHQAATSDDDRRGGLGEHSNFNDSKKSCCQDYCSIAAINCGNVYLKHPRIEPVRAFLNDARYVGQAPTVPLPPDI